MDLLEALANPCYEVQRLLAMANDWRSDRAYHADRASGHPVPAIDTGHQARTHHPRLGVATGTARRNVSVMTHGMIMNEPMMVWVSRV